MSSSRTNVYTSPQMAVTYNVNDEEETIVQQTVQTIQNDTDDVIIEICGM